MNALRKTLALAAKPFLLASTALVVLFLFLQGPPASSGKGQVNKADHVSATRAACYTLAGFVAAFCESISGFLSSMSPTSILIALAIAAGTALVAYLGELARRWKKDYGGEAATDKPQEAPHG